MQRTPECCKGEKQVPYQSGFDTDDGEFLFLEEFEALQFEGEEQLHLLSSKSPKSLNSQFLREETVYLHPALGYEEGAEVEIASENGTLCLHVKHNEDLREDCLLIYSGTRGVNRLTSSKHSYEGKSAIFQESRVTLKRV